MDTFWLMKWSTALFGVAAVGGLLMLVIRLRGAPRPPSAIAMLHGLLAASAFTLLIVALATVGLPLLCKLALAALVIASVIGTWLNLRFHVQNLELPVKPILLHAAFAVAGLALLVLCLIQPAAVASIGTPFPS